MFSYLNNCQRKVRFWPVAIIGRFPSKANEQLIRSVVAKLAFAARGALPDHRHLREKHSTKETGLWFAKTFG